MVCINFIIIELVFILYCIDLSEPQYCISLRKPQLFILGLDVSKYVNARPIRSFAAIIHCVDCKSLVTDGVVGSIISTHTLLD